MAVPFIFELQLGAAVLVALTVISPVLGHFPGVSFVVDGVITIEGLVGSVRALERRLLLLIDKGAARWALLRLLSDQHHLLEDFILFCS
mgnify:CR=1 FL=1